MFELLEEDEGPPMKPCHGLCAIANVFLSLLLFSVAWVVIGIMCKLCARLFILGWEMV